MSSGGVKYNVQKYDPSEYEAEMQMKRMELTDEVTKKAFGAAKKANVYSDTAIQSLQEGLGLLSNYIDERVSNAQSTNRITEGAVQGMNDLRAQAVAGAGFLSGAAENYLKQANQADDKLQKQLKRRVT